MPSVSAAQRRLFAIAEHHPDQLYGKNKSLARLPHQTLHDFASTPEQHVPHKADGMTNTAWQQSEPGRGGKKRPDWMERAVPKGVPHMADGKKPEEISFRTGKTEKATAEQTPRARKYFKTAW